jgi:CRISPR-associated protein Cas1
MDDLHALPKFRDSLSTLYVEHARIDKHQQSIAVWSADGGFVPVPVASLAVLMLGPGTSITQAAVKVMADNNCLAIWCGEENVRFYAWGTGGTRSAAPILHQARLASQTESRMEVVKRMYRMRFGESADELTSIESLRGREGMRVRGAYADLSRKYGVNWSGRGYDRGSWGNADPANRALSCANACLYGLCHAAILSTGYSPAIGFIHTGKQLSFVYDIGDLYKIDVTIPIAFRIAAEQPTKLEQAVRHACRDAFRETKLIQRIVPDIQKALDVPHDLELELEFAPDEDPALPTALWSPDDDDE